MSVKATSWAWDLTLEPSRKLVLMAICDCHNASTGKCDPSYDYIAQKACVSRSTAMRIVKGLIEEGYLHTLISKSADGKQLPNTYVLHFEIGDSDIEAECQNDTPEIKSRVSNSSVPGVICDTPIKNRKEEPERNNTSAPQNQSVDSFEQFYSKYPNKVGKQHAMKSFHRLSLADQKSLIASVPLFVVWSSKQFKGYSPPHPATYINQRRFDDFKAEPLDWKKIVASARKINAWSSSEWGPSPNTNGCLVPMEFLTDEDRARTWFEWVPSSRPSLPNAAIVNAALKRIPQEKSA